MSHLTPSSYIFWPRDGWASVPVNLHEMSPVIESINWIIYLYHSTEDKTGKGYILGSPSIRVTELERNLSPAFVCLARALLHSSMLLGTYTDKKVTQPLLLSSPYLLPVCPPHLNCNFHMMNSYCPTLGGSFLESQIKKLPCLPGNSESDDREAKGCGRILLGSPSKRYWITGRGT